VDNTQPDSLPVADQPQNSGLGGGD
jgi:hypothetical protein